MNEKPDREWDWWHPSNALRPAGKWRVYQYTFNVAGLQYRRDEVWDFFHGARRSDQDGLDWGLNLWREPDNPADPFAIKVLGRWTGQKRRLFRKPIPFPTAAHIGYLPRELSAYLANFGSGLPVGAELHEMVYRRDIRRSNDPLPLAIVIKVLIPIKRDPIWAEIGFSPDDA